MASLRNGIIRRSRSRTDREVVRSGNRRRRACLGVGAGSGTEEVRAAVEPNHARGIAIGCRDRRLRRVNWRAGMGYAADRTAAIMRGGLTGLIGLAGTRSTLIVTDSGRMQGIGGSNAGCQACCNRCENLHHHGHQDDRKEFPQPPAHQRTLFDILTNHAG
jgi:hypothetical protein